MEMEITSLKSRISLINVLRVGIIKFSDEKIPELELQSGRDSVPSHNCGPNMDCSKHTGDHAAIKTVGLTDQIGTEGGSKWRQCFCKSTLNTFKWEKLSMANMIPTYKNGSITIY